MTTRRADQHGTILPTAAIVASMMVVALGAAYFLLTGSPSDNRAATVAQSKPVATAAPTDTANPAPTVTPKPQPVVHRRQVMVVVFNNSNVHGLAQRTAQRAQTAGWKVVGQSNWYGTVDAPTVYYPAKLRAAAKLLAHDLGIARVKPAIAPMRTDRLTVILTANYAG